MANVRIKDLPSGLPNVNTDYFVFERSAGGGSYVTSTYLLSSIVAIGAQGIQGLSNQGVQGQAGSSQGVQGIQGETGIQGSTGAQGIQGTQGQIGVQGNQGNVGNQGIQGSQGEVGIQGVQGIQGETGIQGATGSTGNTGAQGVQGIQGETGVQGLLGVQGIQGLLGSQGVQGLIGTTFDYTAVTTNITLSSNDGYIFDTTSSALTVTLPASPAVGAYINITLTRGGGNNLIIQRNSSNINGAAEDLTCDVSGTFSLVYTDATTGWKFIPFSGLTYAPATLTVDTITSSKTLELTDSSKFIRANSSSLITVTIPNNSNVQFQNGTQISIMRLGSGAVSLSAQTPVVIHSVEGKLGIRAQDGVATVVRLSADDWALFGDIA